MIFSKPQPGAKLKSHLPGYQGWPAESRSCTIAPPLPPKTMLNGRSVGRSVGPPLLSVFGPGFVFFNIVLGAGGRATHCQTCDLSFAPRCRAWHNLERAVAVEKLKGARCKWWFWLSLLVSKKKQSRCYETQVNCWWTVVNCKLQGRELLVFTTWTVVNGR